MNAVACPEMVQTVRYMFILREYMYISHEYPPQVKKFSALKILHFHKSICSWVENECCCLPRNGTDCSIHVYIKGIYVHITWISPSGQDIFCLKKFTFSQEHLFVDPKWMLLPAPLNISNANFTTKMHTIWTVKTVHDLAMHGAKSTVAGVELYYQWYSDTSVESLMSLCIGSYKWSINIISSNVLAVDSSPPSAAYMCQWMGSALV